MDVIRTQICVASFKNNKTTEAAVELLLRKSFRDCEISVLTPEDDRSYALKTVITSLSYLRHLQIPELGRFVCAGPIAALLANWSVEGYPEGLTKIFEGLGFTALLANNFFEALRNKESLIYVVASESKMQSMAEQVFEDAGASRVETFQARDLKLESAVFQYQYGDEKFRDRESYRPLN